MSEIVFFGTEEHSLITLKALHEAQFHIAAVITKPDAPKGRGGKLSEPAVKTYAHQHNIPVWQPQRHFASHSNAQIACRRFGQLWQNYTSSSHRLI